MKKSLTNIFRKISILKRRKSRKRKRKRNLRLYNKDFMQNEKHAKAFVEMEEEARINLEDILNRFSQKNKQIEGIELYQKVMVYLNIINKNFNMTGARYFALPILTGMISSSISFMITNYSSPELKALILDLINKPLNLSIKVSYIGLIALGSLILFILPIIIIAGVPQLFVRRHDRKLRAEYQLNSMMIEILQEKIDTQS